MIHLRTIICTITSISLLYVFIPTSASCHSLFVKDISTQLKKLDVSPTIIITNGKGTFLAQYDDFVIAYDHALNQVGKFACPGSIVSYSVSQDKDIFCVSYKTGNSTSNTDAYSYLLINFQKNIILKLIENVPQKYCLPLVFSTSDVFVGVPGDGLLKFDIDWQTSESIKTVIFPDDVYGAIVKLEDQSLIFATNQEIIVLSRDGKVLQRNSMFQLPQIFSTASEIGWYSIMALMPLNENFQSGILGINDNIIVARHSPFLIGIYSLKGELIDLVLSTAHLGFVSIYISNEDNIIFSTRLHTYDDQSNKSGIYDWAMESQSEYSLDSNIIPASIGIIETDIPQIVDDNLAIVITTNGIMLYDFREKDTWPVPLSGAESLILLAPQEYLLRLVTGEYRLVTVE